MLIRHADPATDAAACAAIYAPSVRDGVASLEERAPEQRELESRIKIVTQTHPWLVCEVDGVLAGYAYAGRHRDRASYRWSTDVTVYVSADHQRRGVGRRLYAELLELLRRQGFHLACAGITLPNDASVGLHRSFGFKLVGVYPNVAYKLGCWRSVGWYVLELGPLDADARPAEPGPPLRLHT